MNEFSSHPTSNINLNLSNRSNGGVLGLITNELINQTEPNIILEKTRYYEYSRLYSEKLLIYISCVLTEIEHKHECDTGLAFKYLEVPWVEDIADLFRDTTPPLGLDETNSLPFYCFDVRFSSIVSNWEHKTEVSNADIDDRMSMGSIT